MDQIVMEKILQTLPRQAATFVRGQEPKSSKEAARFAQYYFRDRHTDPDDQKWNRRNSWTDNHENSGDRVNKYKRRGDSYRHPEGREWKEEESAEKVTDSQKKSDETEQKDAKKIPGPTYHKGGGPRRTGEGRRVQCYECHGWGHMRDICPSRVLFVSSRRPPAERKAPWTVSGHINGMEAKEMLIDTGAEVTVVAKEILPNECLNGKQMEARGLIPTVTTFDLADVTLEVGDWELELEVLVAPLGSLKYTALLGRDIPGLEVTLRPPPREVLPVRTRAAAKRNNKGRMTKPQRNQEQT